MNANELADVIGCVGEDWGATLISNSTLKEAATMLRQQQAEIEKWKEINDRQTRSIKNKQAEIEALKSQLSKYNKPYPKYGVTEC